MTKLKGQSRIYQSQGKQPGPDRFNFDHLKNVYDHSPMGVLAIDKAHIITYANHGALAYAGMEQNKVLGQSFDNLYNDVSPEESNQAKLKRLEEITDQEFSTRAETNPRWVLVSSKIYQDYDGNILTFLFIRDISRLKKKENLISYLHHAATALAKTRDTASALEQIAQFIVPRFADWFTIDQLKENKLELILLKHTDESKIEWALEYRKKYPSDLSGNSGPAIVIKTGKPGFVPVVTEEMTDALIADPLQREEIKKIGLHSVILVPIYTRDEVSGLVNFISSVAGHHFDETDLDFAQHFADLIGLVLENTRLNEEAGREIALRKESESRFRFLTDAIPHKMWTSGPDGRATYYNDQWYHYSGVNGFEALREKVWDLIHPDDRIIAADEWPKAIKKGEDTEFEQRLLRYDGEYRWHLSRFTSHKNDQGEIVLWVGTSTDIHDQKVVTIDLAAANNELSAANEELASSNEEQVATNEELIEVQVSLEKTISELAASEDRFKFLLNAIPQQVWTANAEGALIYVNEVVCKDFGFSVEEVVGQGWQKFIHPDDLPVCLEKWQQSLTSGKEYMVEFRLLFHDRTYRWHLARAVPLIQDEGVRLWIGTNTNIELQKLNEQRKDEFLSIASHELRTPLTSIKAFGQILQKITDTKKREPFEKKSLEQVNKLEQLINDLLDVTKINAGKMAFNLVPFEFGKMVSDMVHGVRLIEEKREIILDNQANINYTGDHQRLEQVLNNFISNALKYSPKGTPVIIRTKIDNGGIVASVQDFGIGIAPENLGRLFDRYYRVDNTAMRFEGLGLGLFISSEILKRHHGSFWIESELGKGSTFFFRLPLPENEKIAPIKDTAENYEDSTIKISVNRKAARLDVDWTGYQNLESVQHGCMKMLEMMKENKLSKIVNDNSHVLGSWSEAVEWTGNVWFPMMENAGLKFFALIYSPSVFSQLSARKSIDVGIGKITAQYFTDLSLAEEWVDKSF